MPVHNVLTSLDAGMADGYGAVLCDLDGCLIAGGTALPGAREFALEVSERLWIVSNNSSDTARTLAKRLAELGIEIAPNRILLAGEQAVGHLASTSPGARLRCLTDLPVRQVARDLGFNLTSERNDHVLLGRMAAFDLDHLERLVADLADGARLWVTNADRTHPGRNGMPVPETGAWLAAVRACLPGQAYNCFGKPSPFLLAEALRRAGTQASQSVFVGDNPETDGAAARSEGMDFLEIRHLPDRRAPFQDHQPKASEGARC